MAASIATRVPSMSRVSFPAEGHQRQQAATDDDGLPNEFCQDHGEGVPDGLDVGGDAAAEIPDAAGVEEGHRLGDHAGEGVLPQGLEHARCDFPEQPDADETQRALDHEHDENGDANLLQVARIDGQGQVESARPAEASTPTPPSCPQSRVTTRVSTPDSVMSTMPTANFEAVRAAGRG